MRPGYWIIIALALLNAICAATIGIAHSRIEDLEAKLKDEQATNVRLSEQITAFNKLKTMTLRMGSEPLHLSGSMWVVFAEDRR